MVKRALVTGAGGFVGGFLVEALLARGWSVYGLDAAPYAWPVPKGADYHFIQAGLLEPEALTGALRVAQPDAVFHLAAQSYPRVSWERPVETFEVNVLGFIHLLDALRKLGQTPRLVLAGSSAEYAPTADGSPIGEDTLVAPLTPYGISKRAQDDLAVLFGVRDHLPAIRVRPFFLVGPRKRGDVCSDWARGVVAMERGEAKVLRVGDVEIVRDMLDVRDGAAALIRVAEAGRPGEVYNICSGEGTPLRCVLEAYRAHAKVPLETEVDPARMRAGDERVRIGDPAKLKALGWMPEHPLSSSFESILNYWREAGA